MMWRGASFRYASPCTICAVTAFASFSGSTCKGPLQCSPRIAGTEQQGNHDTGGGPSSQEYSSRLSLSLPVPHGPPRASGQ